ncbi:anthranilate phosphoribosyltransferase [Rhodococcus sp. BP-149]|uniref:anthranilate phosphoribosyltransferase n=1 Tax=unclassified Rhodococcus (in: high G+C Gram-positive bacteria) TaxID=192944 RepID=UPI001C9B9F8C|nr:MULTISPECIES: anthranilate phosphoribosyltransferase [unclassified Rhodococcus (in: high G+C Gram-positive bacteria)]MBY6686052.1 anthranilate phosphoribosyltransferase [Rhodococcus sp. BP-288]MBY6696123.1 anthranilate phosphoribosyltransferase [Rhodococcus sp. BP-188]MBY6700720.1 anthranilate phosphoribosyltransferase [Rhodococcus sp. BP-285]MBY6703224.1 anthranilate phosphoribosyltransferase [Rhodococcus sp. BP-283]MBY6711196.1 anthranilate phosphoribosyltransferase [Rhodococcus sp. BP-16
MSAGDGTRTWAQVLGALASRQDLTGADTAWAMDEIMSDNATAAQIAAFGVALKMKGPTSDELRGLADSMLGHAKRVPVDDDVVDIVGTGGDRSHTVNISTMASVVVAAAGIRVVKHGNRAASSKSGGADVLEALGVRIDQGPERVAASVAELGIGFCFAPVFHPALRFAAAPRKEIGIPTAFNVLGPLTNPASPRAGLVGCAFDDLIDVVAGVFAARGNSVLVVRGDDGLDEITTSTTTSVRVVRNGVVDHAVLDPRDLGIERVPLDALRGGDAEDNAAAARRVFAGETGPVRDAVLLNAAGAIAAFRGVDGSLEDAMAGALTTAAAAVDDGAAQTLLTRWAAFTSA